MDGVSHDHKSLNRLYGNQKVASGGSNLKFEFSKVASGGSLFLSNWHPEVQFLAWSDFWARKKMTTKS